MGAPMSVCFLLFHSIHDVLKAEKTLKEGGLEFELVPIPRNLSSDCGMCVKLACSFEDVKPHIGHIEIERCFSFDGSEYTEVWYLKSGQ
jgi:hypothetical protein